MLYMNQPPVRHEVLIVTDTSHYFPVVFYLLSLPSSIPKYVTSIASRDATHKLKLKIVLIYLSHSWITY